MTVTGLHLDEGFCVRFPGDGALETWEEWSESDFLAPDGSVDMRGGVSPAMLAEARAVLQDAEDGCHLHLHLHDGDS